MDNPYKAVNHLIKSKDWDYRLNFFRDRIKDSTVDERAKSELAIQIVNQNEQAFQLACKNILRILFKNNPIVGFAIHYSNTPFQSVHYKVFKTCIPKHGDTISGLEELFFDSGIDVNSAYDSYDCEEFIALICSKGRNRVKEIMNTFEFNYHNIRLLQFEENPSTRYKLYVFEFSKSYTDFFVNPGDYLPLIRELKDFQIELKVSVQNINDELIKSIDHNNRIISILNR